MPDDLRLAPGDALLLAQRLIDDGRPFHAHEVLEAVWKAAPDDQRGLWKGLAQLTVGLTHARRGNDRGAVSLLRRGASAIAGYGRAWPGSAVPDAADLTGAVPDALDLTGAVPDALDLTGAVLRAGELATRIERAGLAAVTEDELRLRLVALPPEP